MTKITVQLRKAAPDEFAVKKGQIKPGKLFFLKSSKTGNFDRGIYYTYDGMNLEEFRKWFLLEMVYVPINPIDSINILQK